MYFEYGEAEIDYLSKRDKRLGEAIKRIGHIYRGVEPDLFASVILHIIGQQISTAGQITIWRRMKDSLGVVVPETIINASEEDLQKTGISFRKVSYIKEFAEKVYNGTLVLDDLWHEPDEVVISRLSECKGIGVWTAQMLLLFTMQRADVLSFGDLAILRGLRMLYHHKEISKERFEKYRKRYHPYGSVASLYLWAIAGGAIEELKDYSGQKKGQNKQKVRGTLPKVEGL